VEQVPTTRTRIGVWLALLLAAPSSAASAQSILVPTLVRSREPANVTVHLAAWSTELRARGDRPPQPLELTQRFERAHSAPAEEPSLAPFEELERCVEEQMGMVAEQRFAAAAETAARCRRIIDESIAILNRETRSAETVFNGCLFEVRAILEAAGRRDQAEAAARAFAQGMECRRRVPDLTVNSQVHTDDVRAVMERVDAELAGARTSLRVTGSRDGCAVYLNGRRLGATPYVRHGMPRGNYTLQIQCERPSRVYRVTLSGSETVIRIDPALDAVLSSRPYLGLRYDSEEIESARRLDDAAEIARALSAPELWLLSVEEDGSHRVDRFVVGESNVRASVRLSPTPEGSYRHSALGPAIEALRAGRSIDLREAIERPMSAWTPDAPEVAATEPDPAPPLAFDPVPHVLGASALGVVALGLVGSALGLWFDFEWGCGVRSSDDSVCLWGKGPAEYREMMVAAAPLGVLGAAGVLTATGWFLAALADDAVAWYVAGGVAAAASVAALTALIVSETTQGCRNFASDGSCWTANVFDDESLATWAALAGVFAAGSVTYFVLGATDEGRGPRLRAGIGLGSFSIAGSFQ
jgi:hypothetical protein